MRASNVQRPTSDEDVSAVCLPALEVPTLILKFLQIFDRRTLFGIRPKAIYRKPEYL